VPLSLPLQALHEPRHGLQRRVDIALVDVQRRPQPHVLDMGHGLDEELAHSSLRFGIGRFNTEEEVDYVADLLIKKVKKLRDISPLYEMHQQGIDIKSIQWAAH